MPRTKPPEESAPANTDRELLAIEQIARSLQRLDQRKSRYATWEQLRAPVTMLGSAFVATELWLGVRGLMKVHAAVPNLVNERQHATQPGLWPPTSTTTRAPRA